jgi:hypothetical protein
MRGRKVRKDRLISFCNICSNLIKGEYLSSIPFKGRLAVKNMPEMGKIIPKRAIPIDL